MIFQDKDILVDMKVKMM